jgi:hypothetical protein
MKIRPNFIALLALAISVWFTVVSCGGSPPRASGLSPETIADYMYRLLKSERAVYGKYVVQRLAEENVIHSSENWERDKTLPLPAQMFLMTAEMASRDGSFSYGSISRWPLNENHAPKTDFEKKAMQEILDTGLPFKGYQNKDGRRYFTAVYPDKVVTEACATCHNEHPVHKQRYPDKVFKVGDVMAGILINIPLEEGQS